jgi:hypothetical protein
VSREAHGGLPKKAKTSVSESQHMPRYLVRKSGFRKKPSRFPPPKNEVDPAEQRSSPSSYHPDSFCRMRRVRMRCAWNEVPPGQGHISSPKRRFHVRPVGHPPSAGVGPAQKWSVPPGRTCWSPKKGNNFGQQKSTLTEIFDRIPKKPSRFGSENSPWVDFLGPIFFPFVAHRW